MEGHFLEKINLQKIADGKDALTYLEYTWDYKSVTNENASEDERIIDWKTLVTYVKDLEDIYEIRLGYFDDVGANIYSNIISTVRISNSPIPNRKFENEYISFEYPAYSKLNAERNKDESPITNERFSIYPISSSSDYLLISIRAAYVDPQKYGEGSFRNKGTWWYQAICKYVGDVHWWYKNEDFSYINGYPSIIKGWDLETNNDQEILIMSKPYVVRLSTEDEESIKFLNLITPTIKIKTPEIKYDQDMINYLKFPPEDQSQMICGNDISIMGR